MNCIEGIDLSGSNIDYAAVAASKVFVYQKLTDGVGSPCSAALPHCNGLRATGMVNVLGGYLFVRIRHGRAQDTDDQVKEFLDMREKCRCPLAPWFDLEASGLAQGVQPVLLDPHADPKAKAVILDEIRAAVLLGLETWEACKGGSLVVYTSPGEASMMGLTQIDELGNYPLALAAYNGGYHVPAPPQPWTAPYAFHQYNGDVSAFGGVVDEVRFFGTLEQLQTL